MSINCSATYLVAHSGFQKFTDLVKTSDTDVMCDVDLYIYYANKLIPNQI